MNRAFKEASDAPGALAHLVSLLRGFSAATLITRSRVGRLQGRPSAIARVEDNATIWLVTSAATLEAEELADDGRAMVTLQASSRFISVNGRAELVVGDARLAALEKAAYPIWDDGGADSELALVHFVAFDAEYWDDSGAFALKQVLRTAKAYVTGQESSGGAAPRVEPTSHARLRLWTPEDEGPTAADHS